MAQKLVYSQSPLADLKKSGQIFYGTSDEIGGYQDPHNEYYYSVVFTADGQIITHGNVYNAVLGDDIETILTGVNNTDDPIKLSVNGGKLSAVLSTKFQSESIYGQYQSDTPSVDTYAIKVPQFTVDIYGRIKSASQHTNAIHADYVKSVASGNSKTYYLLGHEIVPAANANTIASTLTNNKLKAATDNSGNLTLTTQKLVVTDGETGIKLGTETTTLKSYVEGLVNTAKTQAMSFKGTTTSITELMNLPPSSVENGDTYKFTGDTTNQLESTRSSDGQDHDVVTGDILIAVKNDSGLKWAYVPSGDDDVVVDVRIPTGTASQPYNYLKSGGYVELGNAALSTVFNGTLATNTTSNDLTTAAQVAALVSAHAGTVTSITPGEGLKSSITANTWGTSSITTSGSLKVIAATNEAFGGIKLKYAADSTVVSISNTTKDNQNYAIKLDKNGIAYVNVPWETYTVNNAKLTLNIDNQQISDAFTANASANTTYTIPLASFNSGASVYGAIKGTQTSAPTGYSTSPVVNGVVYYQNTWRPVLAYTTDVANNSRSTMSLVSTGTDTLTFGSEFAYVATETVPPPSGNNPPADSGSELHLVWAEIDSKGAMTYHV